MRLRRIFLLQILILVTQLPINAQNIKVVLDPPTVFLNQDYKIKLILPKNLKKEIHSFSYSAFPEIEGFVKLKTEYYEDTENSLYIITQIYLPIKIGKSKLYPFQIKIGAEVISSRGAKIFIRDGGKKTKIVIPSDLEFKEEEADLQFLVSSDKNEVFTGEGFTVTAAFLIGEENKAKIHFKDLLNQATEMARVLSPSNCLIGEASPGIIQNPEIDSIFIGNKLFRRLKLFEVRLFPVNAEEIQFEPISFSIIKYKIAKQSNEVWWKAEDFKLKSEPMKIKVYQLPEHPLKDAVPVGIFQLKESVSSGKVKTGEAFHYTAIIRGNGNIDQVLPPSKKGGEILEIYFPEIKQRIVRENNNFAGKVFEFQIIPKEPGSFKLSKYFNWIYFNTEKRKYDTLYSSIVIHAEGESIKNKEISSTYIGSFYELAGKESNKLRSKEKDESIKFFANFIILFMLVTTAILVFKR